MRHDNVGKLMEDASEHSKNTMKMYDKACERSRLLFAKLRQEDFERTRRHIASLPQQFDQEMNRRLLVFRRRANGMADAG